MDTPIEAMLRALFNDDWFTAIGGDDEFGYSFGHITIKRNEVSHLLAEHSDTVGWYGDPGFDIVGSWYVTINSDGMIRTERYAIDSGMPQQLFGIDEEQYALFLDRTENEV